MKYFLSIEFEEQGAQTSYKVGDPISFISFKGYLKVGIIKEIKYIKDTDVPREYIVDCNGKQYIAVSDYVLKQNSKVLNLKSKISEVNDGFPLRT